MLLEKGPVPLATNTGRNMSTSFLIYDIYIYNTLIYIYELLRNLLILRGLVSGAEHSRFLLGIQSTQWTLPNVAGVA